MIETGYINITDENINYSEGIQAKEKYCSMENGFVINHLITKLFLLVSWILFVKEKV